MYERSLIFMPNSIAENNTIGERIKTIRTALGLNQDLFGDTIGVTKSAISTYEKNTRQPRESTLRLICKKFNVRPAYLKSGKGEIFSNFLAPNELLDLLAVQYDLSQLEKDIIYEYLKLTKKERNVLCKYIRNITSQRSIKESDD